MEILDFLLQITANGNQKSILIFGATLTFHVKKTPKKDEMSLTRDSLAEKSKNLHCSIRRMNGINPLVLWLLFCHSTSSPRLLSFNFQFFYPIFISVSDLECVNELQKLSQRIIFIIVTEAWITIKGSIPPFLIARHYLTIISTDTQHIQKSNTPYYSINFENSLF